MKKSMKKYNKSKENFSSSDDDDIPLKPKPKKNSPTYTNINRNKKSNTDIEQSSDSSDDESLTLATNKLKKCVGKHEKSIDDFSSSDDDLPLKPKQVKGSDLINIRSLSEESDSNVAPILSKPKSSSSIKTSGKRKKDSITTSDTSLVDGETDGKAKSPRKAVYKKIKENDIEYQSASSKEKENQEKTVFFCFNFDCIYILVSLIKIILKINY